MPNTITEYFTDELEEWNHAILFYNSEMDEFEKKLGGVISRNSIMGIAEKVETQQGKLNRISDRFYRLQTEIGNQKEQLKTDSSLIDDDLINETIEKRQVDLRHKMQEAEKEYIDVKFDCYNFLSGILKK